MKPIVRIPLAILLTSAAISLGVVGVEASTQCVRFIQKVRHHKVSAATAARWAAWDKAHPNWHPKKKSPQETLAQLDFACQVPVEVKPVQQDLPPLVIAGFDLPLDMLPPPVQPTVVAMNTPPPNLFPEDQPAQSLVSPPIYAPQYPTLFGFAPIPAVVPPIGATPEPSSWMMLATAMLAIFGMVFRRPRLANALARARH
jgi:hypothetical protein